MPKASLQPFLIRVAVVLAIAFAIFSNIRVILRNYQINQQIEIVQQNVNTLKEENTRLSLLLDYYQTASYQEVQARSQLGVKKPDETAFIVKGIDTTNLSPDPLALTTPASASSSAPITQTNFSRWVNYLSGR